MAETLMTEIDNGVGIITLSRPKQHNAFDDTAILEIAQALRAMEAEPRVRAVILSSTGASFCAGADLKWMKRAAGYSEYENYRDATALAEMLRTLNELTKPTVARVQGPAYGGGVGVIAACDIAVATFDTQFALTEVKLGIIPAVISPYVIAAIGERRARRYMLTGERFSAAEAYRIGLLHEIVPGEEELDEAIGEIVNALLAASPNAQRECKDLIRAVTEKPITREVIDDTTRRITRVRASADAREGMTAFFDKRQPVWGAAGSGGRAK